MTDVEKKPVKKSEKKVTPKSEKKNSAKPLSEKSAPTNAGIYTLIFFITIAMLGGFYLLWQNQQESLVKQQALTKTIDQQLQNIKQQQTTAREENLKQIEEIHTFQENLRHNLTNLIRNKKHLRNDWLMAEAEYLVQLANLRLLLEKDVTTATVALKAADARLAEVADPALLSVRKILNNDIQALNNVPKIDLAGLSVTLSALSNNIPNLPLLTPDPKTHKINQQEKSSSSSQVKSIKDLPAAIWKDIKSLVVIRHHEKPLEPLLAPNQHFFLIQNLSLLLEQARLALLNGHNEIYQERLATTKKWIKQYFDTEHNVTRNMLANINELQKLDIDPPLPDISSTFSAIKKYRTQGQSPDVTVTKVK